MVDGRSVRAESTQVGKGLNQVGLALPVAADEEVESGYQRDFGRTIITKISEAEMGDDHGISRPL